MSDMGASTILQSAKRHLDGGASPNRVISRLMHDFGHFADENKNEEYLWAFVKMGYLRRIMSLYFGREVSQRVLSKIDKTGVPAGLSGMLKAELHGLDGDYFDDDFVLKLKKVYKDFSTFASISDIADETLKREYMSKTTFALLSAIGEASEEVRIELRDRLGKSIAEVLQEPSDKQSKKLNEALETIILSLHKEYWGW